MGRKAMLHFGSDNDATISLQRLYMKLYDPTPKQVARARRTAEVYAHLLQKFLDNLDFIESGKTGFFQTYKKPLKSATKKPDGSQA